MVLLSGAYRLHARHAAAPEAAVFARHLDVVPNVSGRMDELRAALLRPQLAALRDRAALWNERYRALEAAFRRTPGLRVVERPPQEGFVGSSIQVLARDPARVPGFVEGCAARGVAWKWFGGAAAGYTSTHRDWGYLMQPPLAQSDAVLARLLDMRVPLTFSLTDCEQIGRIVRDVADLHLSRR